MKVRINNQKCERLGIFGFSWEEKVAAEMIDHLKGTGYDKNLKAFWGPSGKNTTLVKNLHNVYTQYMMQGNQPPKFVAGQPDQYADYLSQSLSADTATPSIISMEFLKALFNLTQNGRIDYKLYNPIGYKETVETIQEAKPKSGISLVAQETGKIMNKVLIVGGLAIGAYLLTNITKLTKR